MSSYQTRFGDCQQSTAPSDASTASPAVQQLVCLPDVLHAGVLIAFILPGLLSTRLEEELSESRAARRSRM